MLFVLFQFSWHPPFLHKVLKLPRYNHPPVCQKIVMEVSYLFFTGCFYQGTLVTSGTHMHFSTTEIAPIHRGR
ncbi:MAG: hypothetical protein ACM3P1_04685, partial [Candidatus Saccharibacteria bacterium]